MLHLLIQRKILFLFGCLLLFPSPAASASDEYAEPRRKMVEAIRESVSETSRYIDRQELHPRLMSVMGKVERHKFVPRSSRAMAYANQPLPIGHGQTISQPYIVALMTDLVGIDPGEKVLEIAGMAEGDLAMLVSRTADNLRQIASITDVYPAMARSASEAIAIIMREPVLAD